MDVLALAASMVTWVIAIDPSSNPPAPGTSSLASPGTASVSSGPRVASPGPATSWALALALVTASLSLSRSIAACHLVTQAASSAGVRIIRAAPDLSALTGVGATSSALRLWLSSK
jgi:hypothetical protein